jgi:hypothetical protein
MRSKKRSLIALAVGVAQVAGGVVMLFTPGPGILLIATGLGVIASRRNRTRAAVSS